ncbi:hypothetical protein O6H91_01G123800 [Diphasiastrum complanatum]|uniref:Uncharacterized protein n=1 Tax=Diphasiastrum complanatum TaxID=34168 RepID=A0ACC2EVQ2_DIPCM|nr:hypothetical protein O6H91_01G123800 [Diphasiastrum complanatum]
MNEDETRGQCSLLSPEDKQALLDAVTLGCQQAQQLEEKLSSLPVGYLNRIPLTEGKAVHTHLMRDTSGIISAFSKVIFHLANSKAFQTSGVDNILPWSRDVIIGALQSVDRQATVAHTTAHNPIGGVQLGGMLQPITSPLSLRNYLTLPATTEPIFTANVENPNSLLRDLPTLLTRDQGKIPISSHSQPLPPSTGKARSIAHQGLQRRRLPKGLKKMQAAGVDAKGNQVLVSDGHSWRKYGQKYTSESRHPKSYFSCVHKEFGCPAKKYVQRSDQDPSLFSVEYVDSHCCQRSQSLPSKLPSFDGSDISSQNFTFPLDSTSLSLTINPLYSSPLDSLTTNVLLEMEGPANLHQDYYIPITSGV